MAATEVNDIVMRLMAAADHIRGREREEIMHHVGRLSRAAVRERTAAVNEMQRLRKKIVQQSADLKRIENSSRMPAASATQASKASQPPTDGGLARFTESRLQALNSGSTPTLDYEPDYGHLSRPEGLSQPDRRAAAADSGPVLRRGEQQSASKVAPAAFASQSKDSVNQEQPGFGQFNQARFLALQAGPLVTTSSDDAEGRSSPQEGLAQPAYKVTAANAEPVGPRGKNQGETLGGPGSTMQAVDQLLDEIKFSQPMFAGQKRRVSDGDLTAAAAPKKQLMTVATYTAVDAMQPVATGLGAVPGMSDTASLSQTHSILNDPQSALNQSAALRSGRPTCTHCFQHQVPNCDGRAHCNQGGSHKCYYVRCDPETCLGAACVKIHPSQYDLQARKSGQVRRLVIGDPGSLPAGQWDKHAHGKAVAAMGRATAVNQQPFAGLPAPDQGVYHISQGHVKGSGSASRHAIKGSRKGHKTTANPALKSEATHSGPMFDARGIKLESSES